MHCTTGNSSIVIWIHSVRSIHSIQIIVLMTIAIIENIGNTGPLFLKVVVRDLSYDMSCTPEKCPFAGFPTFICVTSNRLYPFLQVAC